MKRLDFIIHGEPKSKGRARHAVMRTADGGFQSRTYTPETTVLYENLVKLTAISAMQEQRIEPFDEPLRVVVRAYFPIPKSATKARRAAIFEGLVAPSAKDLDNIVKAVLDGLNHTAFRDDQLVCKLEAEKAFTEDSPRVEVTVHPRRVSVV